MSAPTKVKSAKDAAREVEEDLLDAAIDRWSDDVRRLSRSLGDIQVDYSDDSDDAPLVVRREEDGVRFEIEYDVRVRVLPPEERTHMGEVPLTGRVFYAGGTDQPPADLSEVLDRDGVPWERDTATGEWHTFGGISDTWQHLRDSWGPLSEMAES